MTAYVKTIWKDHIVEHPNRFIILSNGDGTTTINRSEGEILQQGTPVSAANLQKLEDEVARLSVLVEQHQAKIDNHEIRIDMIEATFADSFTNNQFTEDLTTLDFIKLTKGYYNEALSQLEV